MSRLRDIFLILGTLGVVGVLFIRIMYQRPKYTVLLSMSDLLKEAKAGVAVTAPAAPLTANLVTNSAIPMTSMTSTARTSTGQSIFDVGGTEEEIISLCRKKYGTRRFLDESDGPRDPPVFYTFPGCGNTWGRILIERATGIFTGSVYNDGHIVDSLNGEFICDNTVSVVKAHPHTHPFNGKGGLFKGGFPSDQNKCGRGNIRRFTRAILMVRNPFDAIWSEFQRRFKKGNHVSGISRSNFPWKLWVVNAAWLSYRFREMVQVHYTAVRELCGAAGVVEVSYEELRDKTRRKAGLRRIADFIGRPASDERLECAFAMSSDRRAHRKVDATRDMDKVGAYTLEIACGMWHIFADYGVKTLGYGLPQHLIPQDMEATPDNMDALCAKTKAFPDVELNHKNEPGKHPNGVAAGFGHGLGLKKPMKLSDLQTGEGSSGLSYGAGEGYDKIKKVN